MRKLVRAAMPAVIVLVSAAGATGCVDGSQLRLRAAVTRDVPAPPTTLAATTTTTAPQPPTTAPPESRPEQPIGAPASAPSTAPPTTGVPATGSSGDPDPALPPVTLKPGPFCDAVQAAYGATGQAFGRIDATATATGGQSGGQYAPKWNELAPFLQAVAKLWGRAGELAPPEAKPHTDSLVVVFGAYGSRAADGAMPDPEAGDNPMIHIEAVVRICGGSIN